MTGRVRATDADRQRAAEALAEAYASGQLSLEEHDARSEAAVGAVTVGDLARLTDDLQTPSRPGPPGGPGASRTVPGTRTVGRRAAIIAAVALGGAAVVAVAASRGPSTMKATPEPSSTPTATTPHSETPTASSSPASSAPASILTAAGIAEFVDAYRNQFSTYDTYGFDYYETRVRVKVPTRTPGRLEDWTWEDGVWEQSGEVHQASPVEHIFSLTEVKPRAQIKRLAQLRRDGNVESVTQQRFLARWTLEPGDTGVQFLYYVDGEFGEGAHMSYDHNGRRTGWFPQDR